MFWCGEGQSGKPETARRAEVIALCVRLKLELSRQRSSAAVSYCRAAGAGTDPQDIQTAITDSFPSRIIRKFGGTVHIIHNELGANHCVCKVTRSSNR